MKLFERKQYRVKSASVKDKFYPVTFIKTLGIWICPCACSTMSSRECSHIKKAKNQKWLESFK